MPLNSSITFFSSTISLLAEVTRVLEHEQMVQDSLARVLTPRPETATFSNLIAPLQDAANVSASRLLPITILARVAPDPELREAARQAEAQIAAAESAALMRTDIATLVAAVHDNHLAPTSKIGGSQLVAEDKHLLAYMHGRYLRSGASIHESTTREKYTEAQRRLNELLADARKALVEDAGGIWLERTELDGVSEQTLRSMERREQEGCGQMLFVGLRKSHLAPVMRAARKEQTRKRLYQAKETRFPDNVGRLAEILRLRREIAVLLGFRNHADLKMEGMMHKGATGIQRLLEQTREGLRPFALEEIDTMIRLKREDDPSANKLFFWDWSFYNQKLRKQRYSVDLHYASEFFEVVHTFEQMLRVFETLFDLRFYKTSGSSWHQDVTIYELWDATNDEETLLGHLYVDLFSRDGKYDGACHNVISPVRQSSCYREHPRLEVSIIFWLLLTYSVAGIH